MPTTTLPELTATPLVALLSAAALIRAHAAADQVAAVFRDATIEVRLSPGQGLDGDDPTALPFVEVEVEGQSGGRKVVYLDPDATTPTMALEIARTAALATLNAPGRKALEALDGHDYPDFT